MISKFVVGLAAACASFSALAVEKDITVTANVDTALELTQLDGTPLPSTLALQFFPGQGLRNNEIKTKIFSNAAEKDMQISLMNKPQLIQLSGANPEKVDLAVTFAGKTLSATPTDILAGEAFPGADATGGSIEMPLVIGPVTKNPNIATGSYSGLVSIALVHPTTTL